MEDVRGRAYAVREIALARTRTGAAYLRLVLWDGANRVEARVWEAAVAEQLAGQVKPGDVLMVGEGRWTEYSGEKQLNVAVIRLAKPEEYDPSALRPKKEGVPTAEDLVRAMGSVQRAHLRELLERVVDAATLQEFAGAPAAKGYHHSYEGGLAEHTLEVVGFCEAAAKLYPALDRDLLVTAAILHDVGKLWEYDADSITFERTDPGKLLGHIVLGWELTRRARHEIPRFPEGEGLHLEHLILSHHGQKDWGSPVEPHTPEAVVLHQADLASARVNQALQAVASAVPESWSQKDPSGRCFWAAVRKS